MTKQYTYSQISTSLNIEGELLTEILILMGLGDTQTFDTERYNMIDEFHTFLLSNGDVTDVTTSLELFEENLEAQRYQSEMLDGDSNIDVIDLMSQVSAVSDAVRFQEMRMKYFQNFLEHGVPSELLSDASKKSLSVEQAKLRETAKRFLEMQDRKYFPSAYQSTMRLKQVSSPVNLLGSQP
jgi:hypothetical protein